MVKRELDEWIMTIIGSFIFMVVGDDFIRSCCNYFTEHHEFCFNIYRDNKQLLFLLIGGLFGTILLNMVVLAIKGIEDLKSKVLKYIKK